MSVSALAFSADHPDVVDGLVEDNLGLVGKVARRHLHCGLEWEDLFQEGCIGLVEAARSYDEKRGKFSTWACSLIRFYILRALNRRYGYLLRVSINEYAKKEIRESLPGIISLADLTPDQEPSLQLNPTASLEEAEVKGVIEKALLDLSKRESVILRCRFGFFQGRCMTLRETGEILGLTRERVRQLEKLALEKLRARLKRRVN